MKDSQYFALKKLHSLSGVVPVGGFVVFHLFENSHSVAGAEAFNGFTAFMRSQPYLYLIETALLLPIAFHALLGLYLAKAAKYNNLRYANRGNASYTLQRVTGIGLLFFIAFHLYNTRFAGVDSSHMFQHLAEGYSNPLIFIGYILGIGAAAFHLGNGLWGFSISWGLVTGQKSQDTLWKACMGLALGTFLMGLNALLGFQGRGFDIFQHEKTPPSTSSGPAAPAPAAPAPTEKKVH